MMRLRASLQSVVLVPVLGLLLLAGFALYFLVLRTVSSYADASIRSNLASLLVNALTIADSEVDRQNREGRVDDPAAALFYQLNARMRFEDFARDQQVGLIVAVNGIPEFATGIGEADAIRIVNSMPSTIAGRIELTDGGLHYLSAASFAPWNWRLLLAKDARSFDALVGEVRAIYAGSALGLAAIAGLLVFWLRQVLVRPIYDIARDFGESQPSNYQGVRELEYLSGSIGSMLESLRAKSLHLETTLQSMTDGIAVFDGDMRLVAWNQHYEKLYRYPEGFIRQGMKFSEIIRYNADRGDYGPDNTETWMEEIIERARSLTPPRFEIDRADGMSIEVRRAPMPDGGFVTTYADITERKQRMRFEAANGALEQLSKQLAKYLSPQIYKSIFSGNQEVKLVSQRKRLTVFFSDLAGFAETTERLESEDLTRLLNQYLTEMSQIALAHGATIDKYVGDAILIFFGDPETRGIKEDAVACVKMAIAMRKRMEDLKDVWLAAGVEAPLRCRMGINTGVCTVGNFGSEDRMDYTIIGGGVNLAARLETACPPNEILISFETHAHVKDQIYCEEQSEIKVKGIAHPVATYRVVDSYENLSEDSQVVRTKLPHFRLDIDIPLMSAEEQREAAAVLLEAAERLSVAKSKA